MADKNPKLAYDVNVGSMKNILRAIQSLQLKDVMLVNIGTVAETGDRLPPAHWGRVGYPINPSIFDSYATSKITAERLVIESGLNKWVSLRQTGILHYGLLNTMEGIMFHQPLNNVIEWITEDDSGRLLANICLKNLPDNFYRSVYNIGGGATCRLNNFCFMSQMFGVLGIENIKDIFEPNWFALKNFHGQYYLDSDEINDILNFRRESFEDFIVRLKNNIPFPYNFLKFIPKTIIKNIIMKRTALSVSGPLRWVKNKELEKIDGFFGSIEKWHLIQSWQQLELSIDYKTYKKNRTWLC